MTSKIVFVKYASKDTSLRRFKLQVKDGSDLYSLYQTAFETLVEKSNGAVISSYELARPDGTNIVDEALDKRIEEESVEYFVLRLIPKVGEVDYNNPFSRLSIADNPPVSNFSSAAPTQLDIKIERRIGQLRGCNGAELNTEPRGSKTIHSSSNRIEIDLKPSLDDNACLEGFNIASVDKLAANVWNTLKQQLQSKQLIKPKAGDDEESVVQPFIQSIFNIVFDCASGLKLKMNRLFHEYDATESDGKRPDWVASRPNEQKLSPRNKLFFIEAKQIQTFRLGGSRKGNTSKSEDVLLRDAMAQLIHHIATRHEETGRSTTHGIGVALNGISLQLIRVNFQDNGFDSVFPIFKSSKQCLIPENLDTATFPLAIQWLCALLVENEADRFGLEKYEDKLQIPSQFEVQSILGEGGFGIVFKVEKNVEGCCEQFAIKVIRHRGKKDETTVLFQEKKIITLLNNNKVPRVPTLHNFEPVVADPCLVMTPVGKPLVDYVKTSSAETLPAFAEMLLQKLYETLTASHTANILHCDIRPSNIILHENEPYLIDWGLGNSFPSLLYRYELFGVNEFMATDKVLLTLQPPSTEWKPTKEHDLQALLFTYVAILNADCEAPWETSHQGKQTIQNMITMRREWFQKNELCAFVKNTADLNNAVNNICNTP